MRWHGIVTGLGLIVGLLIIAIALAFLAQRLDTPRPIVLAVGGLVLGIIWHLIPNTPVLHLAPDLVLALFLPPVLAWASFTVPLGAFRANLHWIILFAVGLVAVTMVVVAVVAHALGPAMPLAAALALGALVAPPDPVAATSVGGELGLRNRLVTVLDGEGLVNDATSIVLYNLAIAAVVTGHFSWWHGLLELVRTIPIGVAVGLAVGWATAAVRRRVDDAVLETTLSLIVPFLAYLLAGWARGSEVLSVVALGLYLRRHVTDIEAPSTRLVSDTVWRTVDFVVEGIVFLMVGAVLGETAAEVLSLSILWQGVVVSAAAIALRLVWMHVVPRVVYLIRPPREDEPASSAERTVLGWAGLRGVVSLALALAIPEQIASGAPFPARGWLVLVAYIVIFVTLILQGLTLAPLIHRLGVGDPGAERREEIAARRLAVHAAADRIDEITRQEAIPPAERARIRARLAHDLGLARTPGAESAQAELHDRVRQILREALIAERDEVLRLRNAGQVSDDVARQLEMELNLDLLRLHRLRRRPAQP
jgi:CPA1 family monovalent cation:H+ antiporter